LPESPSTPISRNVTPIRQLQIARFDGKCWVLFGEVLGEKKLRRRHSGANETTPSLRANGSRDCAPARQAPRSSPESLNGKHGLLRRLRFSQ
jgi:hypothetical protein